MKGKLFAATTAAAALLALATACGGRAAPMPTPTPATPYTCDGQKAWLAPNIPFNVTPALNEFFHTTDIDDDICDKVFDFGDYTVVFARSNRLIGYYDSSGEAIFSNPSAAYVFKILPSSSSGLGLVGVVPNFGHHKQALVAGDNLILASTIKYQDLEQYVTTRENNAMLNANAHALNYYLGGESKNYFLDPTNNNLQFGSKISVYRLGNVQVRPYIHNAELTVSVLEEIAAIPVYFGRDVEVDKMELVQQQGKPTLQLRVSEIRPNGQRCAIIEQGLVDLEWVVRSGIITDIPLFKAPNRITCR